MGTNQENNKTLSLLSFACSLSLMYIPLRERERASERMREG
jgi:hypothetical protein